MNAVLEKMFEGIQDPRVNRTRWHNLIDILYITFCTVLSEDS